jgi:YD repeat-containing protein
LTRNSLFEKLKARRGDFTGADPAPASFTAAAGTQRYQYDFVGNIRSTDILANASEQQSAADRKLAGSFNAVNEQTNYVEQVGASTSTATFAITHDAAGNVRTRETVAGGNRLAYRHDRWGRLTEVNFEIRNTAGYDARPRARYRYNPLGMRALVERDANTTDTSHSINERRYLYFKSGCEQQPSPNARETRPQRGRVFRFLRSDFEGWARAVGAAVSRGLHHGVAGLPRWPTGWAESLSGSLAGQGAGLREGRSRWSGQYPRGRPRWFGPDPLRTVTRG